MDGNNAASIIDVVERLDVTGIEAVARPEGGAAVFATVPKGRSVVDLKPILDSFRDLPERRKGTAKLTDATSFVAHVNRFAGAASAVFANPNPSAPSLTAVYDYHPSGSDAKVADWLRHRAVYAPELSEEWKSWTAHQDAGMNQSAFASFIEDHITDVIVPNLDDPKLASFATLVQGKFAEPSDLLQLSRGLEINVDTNVKNAVTLSTGEISVRYEENIRDGAGQPINVANLFQICIPVFYAGPLYRIAVRLRFRKSGDRLMWTYLLTRSDLVFEDAFRGIVKHVRDETTAPVFLGSPEAQ